MPLRAFCLFLPKRSIWTAWSRLQRRLVLMPLRASCLFPHNSYSGLPTTPAHHVLMPLRASCLFPLAAYVRQPGREPVGEVLMPLRASCLFPRMDGRGNQPACSGYTGCLNAPPSFLSISTHVAGQHGDASWYGQVLMPL